MESIEKIRVHFVESFRHNGIRIRAAEIAELKKELPPIEDEVFEMPGEYYATPPAPQIGWSPIRPLVSSRNSMRNCSSHFEVSTKSVFSFILMESHRKFWEEPREE